LSIALPLRFKGDRLFAVVEFTGALGDSFCLRLQRRQAVFQLSTPLTRKLIEFIQGAIPELRIER
jgi:hypothetical protein